MNRCSMMFENKQFPQVDFTPSLPETKASRNIDITRMYAEYLRGKTSLNLISISLDNITFDI